MPKRILVGTDGSDTAAIAVRRAAGLARDTGAELLVFTAYQRPKGEASAKRVLSPVVREAKKIVKSVRSVIKEGNPADAILDAAEEQDADLIVVGNKGMHGHTRFFLGNVPNRVSHNAKCNVLIVKTT